MAIPATPTNFYAQTANQQNFLSWDITVGATSYSLQRSTDNITFTTLASPTINNYLDTSVIVGTQYWYQVAATNGSGTSPYTTSQSLIPTLAGDASLGQMRLNAQQRADRVNSNFVTLPEWNSYINQSLFELYDLLITCYGEEYFVAPTAQFVTNGSTAIYPMPDGVTSFTNSAGASFVPQPFYKLLGVDLGISTANNAYVTVKRFNFLDRNRYLYLNSASTIYGVFNMQYRLLGNNIEFIPTPSGNQPIRLWYIPRMTMLLKDTDITPAGVSGWWEYVITDAAIKALQKEEADVSILAMQKAALIQRIQGAAPNRDAGQPDTITDSRNATGPWGSGSGFGWGGGPSGGWAVLPPALFINNTANISLIDPVKFTQSGLGYVALGVAVTYLGYLAFRELSGSVFFSRIRDFITNSASTLISHIRIIVGHSSDKQVARVNAQPNIASMAHNQMIWYRLPSNQFQDNTVGFDVLFRAVTSTRLESAITSPVLVSSPKPTGFSFINFSPKFLFVKLHVIYSNMFRGKSK